MKAGRKGNVSARGRLGRACADESRQSRASTQPKQPGTARAAVGMSQQGREALAGQQHNLLLPQVRSHPSAVLCQEEPKLAPLLLPIAAYI